MRQLIANELILSFVPDGEQRIGRSLTRMKLQLTRDRVSTNCSSLHCNRSSPNRANCLGSVSPSAKAQYRTNADRFLENLRDDWPSLDWSYTRIRRAGSNSGGLPKRTGNVGEKGTRDVRLPGLQTYQPE